MGVIWPLLAPRCGAWYRACQAPRLACTPLCTPWGRRQRADLVSNCNYLASRFSSAVEQRFCKPKVGSSILSTGTMRRVPSLLARTQVNAPPSEASRT